MSSGPSKEAVFTTLPSSPVLSQEIELVSMGGFTWTSQGMRVETNKSPDKTIEEFFS